MSVMFERGGWFDRLDERAGDALEALLRRHHHRRLRRLGWQDALTPVDGGGWWSSRAAIRDGNSMDVFIDGADGLAEMEEAIRGARHSVHIAGWHATPDFRLTRGPAATPLRDLLAETAERVPVRLLLWAGPPLPAFQPTRRAVRRAQQEFLRDSRLRCALDQRERTLHCHHEKIVIVDNDVAFVGGVDMTALQGDRYDDPAHGLRAGLGWHDAAVRLRGPAVADVARHFSQRWREVTAESLSEPTEPAPTGELRVQVLRTVPERTYRFAPRGDFTILDAYLEALTVAERYIYLENQFLWSPEVVDALIDKVQHPPCDDFRVLLLLPAKPSNGADTTRGQLGRLLNADAGAGRVLATTLVAYEGEKSTPVYVHAKVGIIDDRWLTIGSANLNEHSLFNDTEMNVSTTDTALARDTRLRLWAEHTERAIEDLDEDPCATIDKVWRPTAEDQARREKTGLPRTHRLTLLADVSRRTHRLEGPVRGMLVDG